MSQDPLIRKKYRHFKELRAKQLGPGFIERMEQDKSLRNIIDSAKTNQLDFEDMLAFARKNSIQHFDE